MAFVEKLLNVFKLNDDDEFDDDDDIMETPRETKHAPVVQEPPKRFEARPMRSVKTQSSYSREEEETYESPRRVTRPERQPIPMRSASQGLEVSIMQPKRFEESKDVCDMLRAERAIIINLESTPKEEAHRIMYFIFGAIYSLDAKIHQISEHVFCVSPAKVDISGDYIEMLSKNDEFILPQSMK